MHEAGLAGAVLAALREHPADGGRLRVYLWTSSPPAELARSITAYLAAADPPVAVPVIEVVPRAQVRTCAACAASWPSTEPDPPCPDCGGPPLPPVHDHRIEIEFPR